MDDASGDLARLKASVSEPQVAELVRSLVNIPSAVGSEGPIGIFLRDHLSAAGLDCRLAEVEGGRSNVIARWPGKGTGPTLLFVGHLDTAWAGDEEGLPRSSGWQPTAVTDGEWIIGLGAYNMKGGLASAIYAVELIARNGESLGGDVIFAGVVGETAHSEVGRYRGSRFRGLGLGARSLIVQGVNADFAVIPEPTSGHIDIATGGYLLFEITTSGHPGATYVRGTGVADPPDDAIRNAMQLVDAVDEWAADYVERTRSEGRVATAVTLIGIEGGHPWRPSKTPSFCRLYFEIQVLPHAPLVDIELEFRSVIARVDDDGNGLRSRVNLVQSAPGSMIDANDPIVEHLALAHERVIGRVPEITFDGFYADSTVLTRWGIPTAVYSPVGRGRGGTVNTYPREGEMCRVGDVADGARVFVDLAFDMCNRPRSEIISIGPRPSSTVMR